MVHEKLPAPRSTGRYIEKRIESYHEMRDIPNLLMLPWCYAHRSVRSLDDPRYQESAFAFKGNLENQNVTAQTQQN